LRTVLFALGLGACWLGAYAAGEQGGNAPAAAVPAAAIADEYAFIADTRCYCGAALVPYDNFVHYDWAHDRILEVVLSRCERCREERPFYFDLTPRYGALSAFRAAKLATRAHAGPADDEPCPAPTSAVVVGSIAEEYIFLETTRHRCGRCYESAGQRLAEEGGSYYDVLTATCPACGVKVEFYFDVGSFFGDFASYPEMIHQQYERTPPAPLPGRTPATAIAGSAEERARWLAAARHAADDGGLRVVNRGRWAGADGEYEVIDAACEKCGAPVRLFFITDAGAHTP